MAGYYHCHFCGSSPGIFFLFFFFYIHLQGHLKVRQPSMPRGNLELGKRLVFQRSDCQLLDQEMDGGASRLRECRSGGGEQGAEVEDSESWHGGPCLAAAEQRRTELPM